MLAGDTPLVQSKSLGSQPPFLRTAWSRQEGVVTAEGPQWFLSGVARAPTAPPWYERHRCVLKGGRRAKLGLRALRLPLVGLLLDASTRYCREPSPRFVWSYCAPERVAV